MDLVIGSPENTRSASTPLSGADSELDAVLPNPPQSKLAIRDVVRGFGLRDIWALLAWEDIRQRYRRSVLGPLWLTISMGAMVGGMGLLYAGLFRTEMADYLPFLALGIIVWTLLNGCIGDGCSAFIQAGVIIKQVQLPLSVHVYRVIWRNLIIFAHNLLIFAIVAILFSIWPGAAGLVAVLGMLILCLNGLWVGILLGLISARFRDVPQVVASVMQVAFFLTPILWKPEQLPGRAWVVDFNPFYYLLELVRAPLLGQIPAPRIWLGAVAITMVGWMITFFMFARYRRRIAYWV